MFLPGDAPLPQTGAAPPLAAMAASRVRLADMQQQIAYAASQSLYLPAVETYLPLGWPVANDVAQMRRKTTSYGMGRLRAAPEVVPLNQMDLPGYSVSPGSVIDGGGVVGNFPAWGDDGGCFPIPPVAQTDVSAMSVPITQVVEQSMCEMHPWWCIALAFAGGFVARALID